MNDEFTAVTVVRVFILFYYFHQAPSLCAVIYFYTAWNKWGLSWTPKIFHHLFASTRKLQQFCERTEANMILFSWAENWTVYKWRHKEAWLGINIKLTVYKRFIVTFGWILSSFLVGAVRNRGIMETICWIMFFLEKSSFYRNVQKSSSLSKNRTLA